MALGLQALGLDEDRPAHVVADSLELPALSDLAHVGIVAGPAYSGHMKVVTLTPERLDDLPPALAWLADVLEDWGCAGQVLLDDGELGGWIIYAPAGYVPGVAGLPTAPVSPDAVLLAAVYVAEEHRGGGLARMLVRRMARDLKERQIRAAEAFGDGEGRVRTPKEGGVCVLPLDFLTRVGFAIHRDHGTTPRLRMDLRTAVSWREEVRGAVRRLVPAPAPLPGGIRSSRTAR